MPKIRIATDSTADIPKELCEKHHITVLPLTILAEGKEYRDGVDITPVEFYEILDRSKVLPVSSQVSNVLYTQLYTETWEQGYTDLIQVTINSKGSGTHQAAVLARDLFFEDHPEAKDQLAIHIVDSKTYSMAYGIPVVEAAQMIEEGAALDEVLAHLDDWLVHARPMFIPLNLRCVRKSGRISPAAAFVGDAIGLKPLITFEDGEPKILSKARGDHKAIAALVETCKRERRPGTNYALVHGYNEAALEQVRALVAQELDMPPMVEYYVGCIIGLNTGPDMVGLIYRR